MSTPTETFDALLKVVIIGDTSVGKTCLILRYTQDIFRENFLSTIGVDFKTKTVEVGSKRFKLQLWDTAGQERYNTIRKGFYRGAKGVVVVYDITNPSSFSNLTKWISDIDANCGDGHDKPVVMVMANKKDRESERRIPKVAGEEASLEHDTKFAEVSALTGAGVEQAFEILVSGITEVLENQESTQTDMVDGSVKLTYSNDKFSRRKGDCTC